MELNIFSSNTTNMATAAVINNLGKNNTSLSNHIVIVPDRYSLSVEKEIYDRLNLKGSFNIDVVSFSRLAQKTLELKNRFLSKEATVMLMKKVIDSNKKEFAYFNKMTFSIGFAREMFAVVASLRNSSISPKQFETVTLKMPKEKRNKYNDIAIIYKKYIDSLKASYNDTISRLEKFIEIIKDSELVSQSHVYIVGFNVYSQKQVDIICQLMKYSKSVNIAAATDSGGANKNLFPTLPLEILKQFALDNNIKTKDEYYFQKLKSPFDFLHRELFAYTNKTNSQKSDGKVVLFNEKNPYEEVKAIAREIVYNVRQGKRYKNISVVCCNDDYKKCIADIFDRFDIPFFIDRRYSAGYSLTAKYLLAVMETLMHNFRRENVMELIKHPYFGLDKNTAFMFENYCLEYNINFSRFLKQFSLGNCNKSEEIRKKAAAIISGQKLEKAYQISDFLLKNLDKAQIDWRQNHPNFEASEQSHDKIIDLIVEIKELLGEEEMDISEYHSIFTAGLNSMELALLPQYIDSVFVGNTKESRFSENDILFIVGANQGFFPFKNPEQTIISYADLVNLKQYGLDIKPNPMESNIFEQFIITDLITKAKKLYVSASFYNLKGESMLYGEGLKELSFLLQSQITTGIEHQEFDKKQALVYRLATKNSAFYEYISGVNPEYNEALKKWLMENGFAKKLEGIQNNNQRLDIADNLADYYFKQKSGDYITSVSQLESYFKCPYIHFLRYGVKVKEKTLADLRVKDIGIIIHNILEKYFTFTINKLKEIKLKEIEFFARKAISEVFDEELEKRFSQDEYGKNILNNIKNECMFAIKKLTENVKNSLFEPKYIELYFSKDNKEFKALRIDTSVGAFSIHGKIDRVDTYKNKVAIIDYKTGWAEGKIKDVFYGNKIQLYVYLSVFLKNGYKPAGVFYLPISDGYRSKKERFALQGQVEKSPQTINAIDKVFVKEALKSGQKVNSEIINLSASPNIDPDKAVNNTKNMLGTKDFDTICDYVHKMMENAIDEICNGNIDKAPIKDACKYCAYINHCPRDEKIEREQPTIKIEDFYIGEDKDV